jgi:hypothetical protein
MFSLWRWVKHLWSPAPELVIPVSVPPPPPPRLPAPQPEPEPPPQPDPKPEPNPQPEPEEPKAKRKYDSSYIGLRRDLAAMANYILDRFESLQHKRSATDHDGQNRDRLSDLWGCDFLLLHRELGERMIGGSKWSTVDATAIELTAAIWPIDYAIAELMVAGEYGAVLDGIFLTRVCSVTAKEVRGKVKRIAPKMVRYTMGYFYDNGQWSVCEGYAGLFGDRWVILAIAADEWPLEEKQVREELINRIFNSAFTARYEWHVAFGTVPGGPRLLFPTNPAGALHLFNNRDRAPGKARREALKHWVEEHYRDSPEDLSYVCHHLRGHTEFTWAGFNSELFVSQYDLEMNKLFKLQAKEWRSQRKHNRVKVHLKKKSHEETRPHA